jgi:acetyltransferase
MPNVKAIMEPKSIAVIGATERPGSVGRAVVTNILEGGFKGVLYPVNTNARSIISIRAYPSIGAIPDEVDMAVVIVPAPMVTNVVSDAADKGVKGVVVITAGFKEVGGKGRLLEEELKALVKARDIRLVGPNCLGVINTTASVSMNASFARHMPKPGNIALISQSGALCTAALDLAKGRNIGFSKFISFGNKADVSEIELLEYLGNDPDTGVILMYLEDITDGRRFMEVARKITYEMEKPMLAIKSGRSEEGARAASSHTGSLAGSDKAYDAIFLQSGIQRVEDVNEMFNHAVAFAQMPRPMGNRIAIVTNAGGPGIMTTDAAIRHNLKLARFTAKTENVLRESLPPTANIHNPVDVIGDADYRRYEAALRAVLDDPGVDGAIVVLTPQKMTDVLETAQIVPKVMHGITKPVLCSFMGIVDVSEGVRYLEEHGIPNYSFPEAAVRAFAAMARYGSKLTPERRKKHGGLEFPVDKARAAELIRVKLGEEDRAHLPQGECKDILEAYGFPLLPSRVVSREEDIEAALKEVGPPVAMKISSRDVVHKFDVGGVKLKINTPEEARQAFRDIVSSVKKFQPDARIEGVLMEKMAPGGEECILGANRDPMFGPICMFGLGGTFVEALQDVTFRLAPMWESSAESMIRSINAFRILQGHRGKPPADLEAIKECILRLAQLVTDHPEIDELDINPLMVYAEGKGCVVADSRMIVRKKG